MSKIVVVGSINVDMILKTNRLPKVGETIFGEKYYKLLGGKGSNQAVSAARLGAKVSMIGCIGDDLDGDYALEKLIAEGIDVSGIKKADANTGLATVTITEGDNSIIVFEGANALLDIDWIKENIDKINDADIVITQFEVALDLVEYLAEYCFKNGIRIVLNPAPFKRISNELLNNVTYLTPNETEFMGIFSSKEYNRILAQHPNIIVTLGSKGVASYSESGDLRITPANNVEVVDTTGAGDTFNGAFAYAICEGMNLEESIRFGNIASSIAIQEIGAQSGMPSLEKVIKIFNK